MYRLLKKCRVPLFFLRAHGVAVRDLDVILRDLHSPYRQFSLELDESLLDGFVSHVRPCATGVDPSHFEI